MVHVLSAVLLTTLLIPSHQHPVPNQKLTKFVQAEPEYASVEEIEGLTPLERDKRQDPMEGQEGDDGQKLDAVEGEDVEEGKPSEDEGAALSPDTVETMKKINPLTIANQVSQMFKKNGISANRPAKEEENPAGEPDIRDASSVVSGDDEESVGQTQGSSYPVASRDIPPKTVKEPKNSPEFGYSVVVLAGDPLRFPIKVGGKGVKVKTNTADSTETQRGEISRNCEAEEKINAVEKNSDKDVRVPKEFSGNPNFPVYDEDFNFIPDPFHGILDQNYWTAEGKGEAKESSANEDSEPKPHSVEARFREGESVVEQKVPCGEPGGKHRKGNVTEVG